jgi:hypothetical protein
MPASAKRIEIDRSGRGIQPGLWDGDQITGSLDKSRKFHYYLEYSLKVPGDGAGFQNLMGSNLSTVSYLQ